MTYTVSYTKAITQLIAHGFVASEIREFLGAGNAPGLFATEPFKAMLKSRDKWRADRRRAGWTDTQIRKAVVGYYDKKKNSPFDFLRLEYRSPLKVDMKSYREAARRRAKRNTAKLYKPAYRLLKYPPRQPITVAIKGKKVTF